jgi:hypothetical protein
LELVGQEQTWKASKIFLRHMGRVWWGPPWTRFSGKMARLKKSLEVGEILHMGSGMRKTGPCCRGRPDIPPFYYTTGRRICQYLFEKNFAQKKRGLFSPLSQYNQQHKSQKTVFHNQNKRKVFEQFPHPFRKYPDIHTLRFHNTDT